MPYSSSQIHEFQAKDPDVGPILRWKEAGQRPSSEEVAGSSAATKSYWLQWDSLELQNGTLYRRNPKASDVHACLQLIVPRCLQTEVMANLHDTLLGGHLGQKKTREKIRRNYFWYGLRDCVKTWIASCDTCGAVKKPVKPPRAPLGRVTVSFPFEVLAADVLGPLPCTSRDNRYILVVTDLFTKWVEVFPIPDQTAETCALKLVTEVFARYGCPYSLLTDQGRNWESKLFAEMCQLLQVRKLRTTPGHPQGNAQTERFNRTLMAMVRSFVTRQDDWDLYLGCLAAAYRSSPNETTGMTPNLLMLGREVRMPIDVVFTNAQTEKEVTSYGEYATGLRNNIQQAHDVARDRLQVAAVLQKETSDGKGCLFSYSPGDLVWYATDIGQQHLAPKLRRSFEGPFLIIHKFNDLIYLIQLDRAGRRKVVHHNKLKPYTGTKTLRWAKVALRRRR